VYTFFKYVFMHVVYTLIGWDYVSELRQPFPKWYINMKPRWNDIERGKPKNSEKNLSQCHCSTQIPRVLNSDLQGERPATNRLSYGTAFQVRYCISKYETIAASLITPCCTLSYRFDVYFVKL
jgi:hypothetical protein